MVQSGIDYRCIIKHRLPLVYSGITHVYVTGDDVGTWSHRTGLGHTERTHSMDDDHELRWHPLPPHLSTSRFSLYFSSFGTFKLSITSYSQTVSKASSVRRLKMFILGLLDCEMKRIGRSCHFTKSKSRYKPN